MAATTMSKEDSALQYKMAISTLLKSAGHKEFMIMFNEARQYSKAQAQVQASKGHVNVDGLCLLNYNLGYDAGLEVVSNILKGFEDELASPASQGKK